MPRYKPIYPYSRREAERTGELNLWSESYAENCTCARDIDRAIADGYGDNRLDRECVKKVISEYGYDRVNWILANTIREGEHDGGEDAVFVLHRALQGRRLRVME